MGGYLPLRVEYRRPVYWDQWCRDQRPRWSELPKDPSHTWSGRIHRSSSCSKLFGPPRSQCPLPDLCPVAQLSWSACSCVCVCVCVCVYERERGESESKKEYNVCELTQTTYFLLGVSAKHFSDDVSTTVSQNATTGSETLMSLNEWCKLCKSM